MSQSSHQNPLFDKNLDRKRSATAVVVKTIKLTLTATTMCPRLALRSTDPVVAMIAVRAIAVRATATERYGYGMTDKENITNIRNAEGILSQGYGVHSPVKVNPKWLQRWASHLNPSTSVWPIADELPASRHGAAAPCLYGEVPVGVLDYKGKS